jgi:hypothetical protein
MNYWDIPGYWNITALAKDNPGLEAQNKSSYFKYNQLTAIKISPALLTWSGILPGAINQTADNDPTVINNTGNANLSVEINATDLTGAIYSNYKIYAGNFSAALSSSGTAPNYAECAGTSMSSSVFTTVTGSNVPRGNLSEGSGTAQEEIYYCVKAVGLVPSQNYGTNSSGAWTIRVVALLAAFVIKRKKKGVKEDKLLSTWALITERIKEKYSLTEIETANLLIEQLRAEYGISKEEIVKVLTQKSKENIPAAIFTKELGGLEALCKYMKENLSMSYHEIAIELARNDRTVWTAYKKAAEKQKERIKAEGCEIFIPASIFKNRSLTVLEAMIVYLKEKNLKYSKIAQILNRDQRNIWTLYSLALKKLNKL